MNGLRHWLSEPRLHFVLLGGSLFGVCASMDRQPVDAARVVRIGEAEVALQQQTWLRQWQCPPTLFFAALLEKFEVVVDANTKALIGPPAEPVQ